MHSLNLTKRLSVQEIKEQLNRPFIHVLKSAKGRFRPELLATVNYIEHEILFQVNSNGKTIHESDDLELAIIAYNNEML